MPGSGKSDQLWRKAGVGAFPGPPGMLREGGNPDLEQRSCVPETKQKEPFSIVLSAISLIENDNPWKGILKRFIVLEAKSRLLAGD